MHAVMHHRAHAVPKPSLAVVIKKDIIKRVESGKASELTELISSSDSLSRKAVTQVRLAMDT